MPKKKFSFKERLKSFKYAFNGVWLMLKEEHNFRIHLFAAVLVIFCSWFFKISYFEWLLVLLLIGWVLCMEIVNTCIEKIMNFISTEKSLTIKKIKDLAAAAVLISAIAAVVIGLIIFAPKVWCFLFPK